MPRKVRLSGAQEAALRREKRIGALLAELESLGYKMPAAEPSPEASEERPAWALEFEEALEDVEGDASDPALALRTVRCLQVVALRQRVTTPNPSQAQRAVWQGIDKQAAAIGMTHNRAEIEALAGRIEEFLRGMDRPHVAKFTPTTSLPRPPTARGGALSRGPRPVPDHPSHSDEKE